MYHFEKETSSSSSSFLNLERKKLGLFEKVTRKFNGSSLEIFLKWLKGPMPLVQTLSHLNFFFFFLERFGKLDFFSNFFFKYIHEQSTSNATWIFRIQRNIETWNKPTKFNLNHDVANQMWSEAKLGHLLLLGPFRMLKTWC